MNEKTTHFGYEIVAENDKQRRVADVFDSVASRYDLMNDLMSGGLHRLWKKFAIEKGNVSVGHKVLDVAGGTGDLSKAFAKKVGSNGEVWLTDINYQMLQRGRNNLLDCGNIVPAVQCDAEKLPFSDNYFDCVIVSFGLRNMTHKDVALQEMTRVLKPGGRLLVLEFSKIWQPLAPLYDFYSFQIIPKIGKFITNDEDSYRYLSESIRMHPDQETLKKMMENVGLERVEYFNMTFGVVALHRGFKKL